MFDTKMMLQHEISFYDLFAFKITTGYGILYYNPLNPLSYDSNHAHILDINGDLEETVANIIRFYHGHGTALRVYQSFIDGELDKLRPVLESRGLTVSVHSNTFMLFEPRKVVSFEPHFAAEGSGIFHRT